MQGIQVLVLLLLQPLQVRREGGSVSRASACCPVRRDIASPGTSTHLPFQQQHCMATCRPDAGSTWAKPSGGAFVRVAGTECGI